MYALLDCNNFYVSCERVFNPKLEKRPVVILSNNDGCIISRSNEAKALGIAMGTPYFQIRTLAQLEQVAVQSSNYTLYGDMSARVLASVRQQVADVEAYSIDEQFLELGQQRINDYGHFGSHLRKTVKQYTGIPTSLGIAKTKTLAKIANHIAKKSLTHGGVYVLDHERLIEEFLSLTPVGDLWGVGRQYAKKLAGYGIRTALDLYDCKESFVKQQMTIVGSRLWYELHGVPCIPLEQVSQPKKNICTSRSFGKMQTELPAIREAVANHAESCATKLRKEGSAANYVQVFIHTHKHSEGPRYANRFTWTLPVASSDSRTLIRYALQGLEKIYRSGYRFQKCGVIVSGLVPEDARQLALFDEPANGKPVLDDNQVMQAMDTINQRFGRHTVRIGSTLTTNQTKGWQMNQTLLSPRYTTRFSDIPVARCG